MAKKAEIDRMEMAKKCSSSSISFVFDFATNKILFAIVFVLEIVVKR